MTDLTIVVDPGRTPAATGPDGAQPKAIPAVAPRPPLAAAPMPQDAAGQPTTLNYSVPEPMSYSGRHFITLELPPDAFAVPQIDRTHLAAATAAAPGPAPAAPMPREADPAAEPGGTSTGLTDAGLSLSAAALLERVSRFGQYPVSHGTSASPAAYMPADPGPTDPGGPAQPDPPSITVTIDSPAADASVPGTAQGVTVPVAGRWSGDAYTGSPTISVAIDGGDPVPATLGNGTWTSPAKFTTSGRHTITAAARVTGAVWRGKPLTARDQTSTAITVALAPVDAPPPVLPAITVADPFGGKILPAPNGSADLTVRGTASATPDAALTITVTDARTGTQVSAQTANGKPEFAVALTLTGLGAHILQVAATTPAGVRSATVTISVTLDPHPPMARLLNKLMIVETLNLTSTLGEYGLGRCVKTIALAAGESTSISIKSYRSDTVTEKSSSSILDSASQDASDAFQSAVSAEQTDKDSQTRANAFSISGSASASWGFGQASLSASDSGSANSAREEAVKRVATATREHALKASANRSMTVNAESASTLTTTQEDSTIRTISNINVGRTLNYVFRQMNQEHIVLYHLTNARVAYYTEDVPLDSNGKLTRDPKNPGNYLLIRNYQEVSLPELGSMLKAILNPNTIDPSKVTQAVINALSGIPDYNDTLQTLVETATPTDSSGNPVPSAAYLRVRNQHTVFKDPYSDFTVQVPGIVLSFDHIVQRTDGIFVEAILGQGDALDTYSHGLQDAAVAAKQADAARGKLAVDLVTAHDDIGAAIYQKVFPMAQPAVPAPGH